MKRKEYPCDTLYTDASQSITWNLFFSLIKLSLMLGVRAQRASQASKESLFIRHQGNQNRM